MNARILEVDDPSMKRTAFRSTVISALGLLIILSALGYSALQLRGLEAQVSHRTKELAATEKALAATRAEVQKQNQIMTEIKERIKVETASMERLKENYQEQKKNLAEAEEELTQLRKKLSAAREAVFYVTMGINSYHQRRYAQAVEAYNRALELDPQNPYVANLKGYSLFKDKKYVDAIIAMRLATELNPNYAWGFFDLARVLCATDKFDEAKAAAKRGIAIRPALKSIMLDDGEFTRLCRPIISDIK